MILGLSACVRKYDVILSGHYYVILSAAKNLRAPWRSFASLRMTYLMMTTILLAAALVPAHSANNLIANGSFELGKVDWAFGQPWAPSELAAMTIDSSTAAIGSQSLRVEGETTFPLLLIVSNLVDMVPGSPYTLSVYLRSAQDTLLAITVGGVGVQEVATNCAVNSTWKRFTLSVPSMPAFRSSVCWVRIGRTFITGNVLRFWVDGVQLEPGSAATTYTNKTPLGFSVTSAQPGNVFGPTDAVSLTASAVNSQASAVSVNGNYTIKNYVGGTAATGSFTMQVPAGGRSTTPIPIALNQMGYFKASFTFDAGASGVTTINTTMARMVKQDYTQVPDSCPFVMDGACLGDTIQLHHWVGSKWMRGIDPTRATGQIQCWANYARRTGTKLMALRCDYPGYDHTIPANEAFPLVRDQYMTEWRNMAQNYGDVIKAYEIWNEVWGPLSPVNYQMVHSAAYDAIKSVRPDALVLANVVDEIWNPCYADEFLKAGGAASTDVMTTHPYIPRSSPDSNDWEESLSKHQARFKAVSGKDMPYWISEFMWWGADDFSARNYPYEHDLNTVGWMHSEREATDWTARSMCMALTAGIQKYFFLMLWSSYEMTSGMTALHPDNTPKPQYVMWGNMSSLLTGAVPAGKTGNGEYLRAYAYTKGNQAMLAYWHAFDDTTIESTITMNLPVEQITLQDIMGNTSTITGQNGVFTLPISGSPRVLISTECPASGLLGSFEPARAGGDLYVVSSVNPSAGNWSRVLRFDSIGQLVGSFGADGQGNEKLRGSLFVTFAPSLVPDSITYQGKLTDGAGQVVADGPYEFRFKFYSASVGGFLLWTSDLMSITTKGGLFTADIDRIPMETVFRGSTVWLEVVVNGETLSSRAKIDAVPFAIRADGKGF